MPTISTFVLGPECYENGRNIDFPFEMGRLISEACRRRRDVAVDGRSALCDVGTEGGERERREEEGKRERAAGQVRLIAPRIES